MQVEFKLIQRRLSLRSGHTRLFMRLLSGLVFKSIRQNIDRELHQLAFYLATPYQAIAVLRQLLHHPIIKASAGVTWTNKSLSISSDETDFIVAELVTA